MSDCGKQNLIGKRASFAANGVKSNNNIGDNQIVRGDGGAKNVQGSSASIDDTGNLTIGDGSPGVDYEIIFDGESNQGSLTWREDEAEFVFSNRIIAEQTSSVPAIFRRDSPSTSSVLRASEFERVTEGTAAAGIGCEIAFRVEDEGGDLETVATMAGILTAVPPEAEQGTIRFQLVSDSSLFTAMELIGSTGNNVELNLSGRIIAEQTSSVPAEFRRNASSTSSVLRALELQRVTEGTAAAGIGCELAFRVEDQGGSLETAATISGILTAVPPAAEQGTLRFQIVSDSSLFTAMELIGSTGDNVVMDVAGDIKQKVYTDDVSNPPTDAELDAIFGTPATVGGGFTAYIDDNGAGNNFYQITSDGANWWIFTGAKAV
jgi:hypothetical protein